MPRLAAIVAIVLSAALFAGSTARAQDSVGYGNARSHPKLSELTSDMSIDLILQNNDNLRPRDEIKVEKITASPFPDRRRVKVTVDVTPFRERPNLEIAIEDRSGKPIAGTSAIALMNFTTSYVLHLRGIDDPAGEYTVRVQLYYESPDAIQHTRESVLHIPTQTPDHDAPDRA